MCIFLRFLIENPNCCTALSYYCLFILEPVMQDLFPSNYILYFFYIAYLAYITELGHIEWRKMDTIKVGT